jgi:hydrogenase/urease accessory protein HupE
VSERRARFTLFLLALVAPAAPAFAHEVRPAYLELRESAAGELDVLWKTPMVGEMRLSLAPVLSGASEELVPLATRRTGSAAVQTWKLRLLEPLRGREVHIDGLSATMTDALLRMEFADGTMWTARLTPKSPGTTIPLRPGGFSVAATYLALGVHHILVGIDHLLFVLALILITRGGWLLVKTVTAFTISHSVTLTLAALGYVHLPPPPVEAIIALSIVFVACEIVRGRQGRPGLTARAPWVVAFSFGLLHGLGFAGALSETGLPDGHIPVALLFFSVGVETGHFLFIGAVLAAVALLRRLIPRVPAWVELVPPYAIGSVAMFWVIQRVLRF